MKRFFLPALLLPFLLNSCSSLGPKRSYNITSMSVLNESDYPIRNLQVYLPKRDKTLTLSSIPGGAESSYGFPVRDYQGNPIDLVWTLQGKQYQTKGIVFKTNPNLPEVIPLNARFVLKDGKKAKATLESAQALLERTERRTR